MLFSRVIFVPYNPNASTKAASEEHCFCQTDGFGCVAAMGLRYRTTDWSARASIFSHEFAHAAGVGLHDDEYYLTDQHSNLVMWSAVAKAANVWSPFARKQIMETNNTCLTPV